MNFECFVSAIAMNYQHVSKKQALSAGPLTTTELGGRFPWLKEIPPVNHSWYITSLQYLV